MKSISIKLTLTAGVACRFCTGILFAPPSIFDKRIRCNTMNKFYTLIINNVIDNLHWSPVDELFVFPIVVVAVVGTDTVGACGSAD